MTDVVIYDVVPRAGVIDLGKQVEGLVTRVVLPNIRRGAGTVQLVHQRSDDQKPYLVPVTEDGESVYWLVSRADTAFPGRGQAELQWLGENGAVAKSITYQTNTTRSMAEPGPEPDEPLKPYTQAVARDAQAAKDAAVNATESARSAEASAGQAGLSAATAVEAARNAEAIVGQAGQSAQSAQAAALAAAQNAAAAETAEEAAKQAKTGAEAAKTEAQTAKNAAEKASQEAKTAQAGAVEAKTAAETAQAKAEEAAQGVAADREQIGANTAGLEAAQQDVTELKAENTALKAETARTARSLGYLWKKSKGIIYDTETVTGSGSSVTVPSGAMDYAALRMVGGMSQRDEENSVLIDAPVDEAKVAGKNVAIPVSAFSKSGIAMTVDADGIYHFSGTALQIVGVTSKRFSLPGGTYTVSINAKTPANVYLSLGSLPQLMVGTNTKKTGNFKGGSTYTYFYIGQGVVMDNVSIAFQVERGSASTAYVPYRDPITYPIPQAIRDLCPDYGQGTAESYNYIDFAAKAYYHVGSMAQDGTWTALATPEIIDLSAVWPDDDFGILQVEAGGTINLHYPALDDGFELAVPSETEVMVDVAKVVETDG